MKTHEAYGAEKVDAVKQSLEEGMTQREAAALHGVSRQWVNRVAQNKHGTPPEHTITINCRFKTSSIWDYAQKL